MRLDSDIYLLGLGIYGLRQLTLETAEVLRAVHAVYHFSGKHGELCGFNGNVYDLRAMYDNTSDWENVHARIARHLVDLAQKDRPIAVAFDGSPMSYCDAAWKLAALGAEAGLKVEALAGVSCFDVLPIQLGFDPGDLGMQTMESTAMVQYGLALNPYLSTLLLQVGHFGVAPGPPPPPRAEGAYALLVDHLLRYFPPDHPAVFIQSASNAAAGSVMLTTEVGRIDEARDKIRPAMTLYLPRIGVPAIAVAKIYQT